MRRRHDDKEDHLGRVVWKHRSNFCHFRQGKIRQKRHIAAIEKRRLSLYTCCHRQGMDGVWHYADLMFSLESLKNAIISCVMTSDRSKSE